jgi:hypothetical protein
VLCVGSLGTAVPSTSGATVNGVVGTSSTVFSFDRRNYGKAMPSSWLAIDLALVHAQRPRSQPCRPTTKHLF